MAYTQIIGKVTAMKRREFLKGALLGVGLCLTGETAARQAIVATQVHHTVESPKSAGKLVYRYVWNESEKGYDLTFVGYDGNTLSLPTNTAEGHDALLRLKEECALTVHIPTTMTNRTTLDTHQLDSLYPAVAVR